MVARVPPQSPRMTVSFSCNYNFSSICRYIYNQRFVTFLNRLTEQKQMFQSCIGIIYAYHVAVIRRGADVPYELLKNQRRPAGVVFVCGMNPTPLLQALVRGCGSSCLRSRTYMSLLCSVSMWSESHTPIPGLHISTGRCYFLQIAFGIAKIYKLVRELFTSCIY